MLWASSTAIVVVNSTAKALQNVQETTQSPHNAKYLAHIQLLSSLLMLITTRGSVWPYKQFSLAQLTINRTVQEFGNTLVK